MQPWVCSWIECVNLYRRELVRSSPPPPRSLRLARVHVGTGGGLDDSGDLEDEEVEDGHAEAAVTAAPMLPKKADRESSTTSTRAAPRPQQSPTRHARRGTTAAVNSVLMSDHYSSDHLVVGQSVGSFSINYFRKKKTLPLCGAYPFVGYCGSFLNKLLSQY